MKREEIFQAICRCTDAPEGEMHRQLYAYAVKRKFPSTEVIYNKLSEMHGQDLPPTPKFEELTEATKVTLTIFRGVAELLEPFADEPIEALQMAGEGSLGKPATDTQPDADLTGGAAVGAPTPIAVDTSDGTTLTQPDCHGIDGDAELRSGNPRKK
jgi:hypothetical protein